MRAKKSSSELYIYMTEHVIHITLLFHDKMNTNKGKNNVTYTTYWSHLDGFLNFIALTLQVGWSGNVKVWHIKQIIQIVCEMNSSCTITTFMFSSPTGMTGIICNTCTYSSSDSQNWRNLLRFCHCFEIHVLYTTRGQGQILQLGNCPNYDICIHQILINCNQMDRIWPITSMKKITFHENVSSICFYLSILRYVKAKINRIIGIQEDFFLCVQSQWGVYLFWYHRF